MTRFLRSPPVVPFYMCRTGPAEGHMKPEKMTDERLEEALRNMGRAWSAMTEREFRSHIAALKTERDAATRHKWTAEADAAKSREEAIALRERVQALEARNATLLDIKRALQREVTDGLRRIAAIRQRLDKEVLAKWLTRWAQCTVEKVAEELSVYLLGEDATEAPEPMPLPLTGTVVRTLGRAEDGTGHVHAVRLALCRFPDGSEVPYLEVSERGGPNTGTRWLALSTAVHALLNLGDSELFDVGNREADTRAMEGAHKLGTNSEPPERICEHDVIPCTTCHPPASPEPTTAEAFATVREARRRMFKFGYLHDEQERADAAIALLERRMGAMGRVMEPFVEAARETLARAEKEGAKPDAKYGLGVPLPLLRDLLAALTDAPPVFTLEAVMAVAHDMRPDGQDDDPELWETQFRERLAATHKPEVPRWPRAGCR